MSTSTRIPSFNDFSPGLFQNDLRPILNAVAKHSRDEAAIFREWKELFGWEKKRIQTNIPATLKSTGLTSGRPLELSSFGHAVLAAESATTAARVFCVEIIKNKNGQKLIDAISNLSNRSERATKGTLQVELKRMGIELSNDTTDHTTLKNWMIAAELVSEKKSGFPKINDSLLKTLIGISSSEMDQLRSLKVSQQVFLQVLRKLHLTEEGPFNAERLYTECRTIAPHDFVGANFAKIIKEPLSSAGWISTSPKRGEGRGGKSGWVAGTTKLLSIPVDHFIPDFNSTVPPELHTKLQTPLHQIKTWLIGSNIHLGGLALELLSLRIILDLRLHPREFRLRGKDTAYAEVDVTAEGDHLLFSRWTFQCKRIDATKNVGLADVAKEVGIAIYMKAHVIVMVSTGGFSREALAYAREIAKATQLQFAFLDGEVIENYLTKGPSSLHAFFMENAHRVMAEKKIQPISIRTV